MNLDLVQSINKIFDDFIRITPIYINIYSQAHLNSYLKRRQMELQSKPEITLPSSINKIIEKEPVDSSSKSQSSIPILSPPPMNQQTGL